MLLELPSSMELLSSFFSSMEHVLEERTSTLAQAKLG
jgi:hypothetical protein